MKGLREKLTPHDIEEDFERFAMKYHFSVTERHKLKKLLNIIKVRHPNDNVCEGSCSSGKEVLSLLDQKIREMEVIY